MAVAHKDIRIKFRVDKRNYEAVGFLKEGEPYVTSNKAFRRTARENGGAIGKKDGGFLKKRLDQLPANLADHLLITKWRYPGHPVYDQFISCFVCGDDHQCFEAAVSVYEELDYHALVIRRLPRR